MVDFTKKANGIISLKVFDDYTQKKEKKTKSSKSIFETPYDSFEHFVEKIT